MEIYLIRHGEIDWNLEGKLQGQENIPLNKTGLKQSEACGEALKAVPLQCVQTSPLSRARRTAEIIADQQECPLIINPSLIERDYGLLSGLTPEKRREFETLGIPDKMEPWNALASRALRTVKEIAGRYPKGSVAAVSHGAWINALLAVISEHKIGTGRTRLKNACISLLCRKSEGWEIEFFNITAEEFAKKLSL